MLQISAWFSVPQIEIWKLQISGDFIKFSECQVRLRQCNPP